MTNENAALANNTAHPNKTRRVSDYENREVDGLALAGDTVYRSKLDKVEGLRQQQAEYFASLPDNPETACKAARKAFQDWGDITSPASIAKANFVILRELMGQCDIDGYPDLVRAMAVLTEQGIEAMAEISDSVKRVDDGAYKALYSEQL